MNKFIYTLITIISFSCISINANALTMVAISSCGQWVTDKIKSKNDLYWGENMWLLGYMNGLVSYSDKDALKNIDPESMLLWVDKYCQANPLKKLNEAGSALFFELTKEKGL